jgi:hypothetical protein
VVVIVLLVIASLAGSGDRRSPSTVVAPLVSISQPPSPEITKTPTVKKTKVPKLNGLSLSTARIRARHSGFEVVVQERYSDEAAGTVLSITPKAGARAIHGSALTLLVAKPLPKVPSVVGNRLALARRTLKQRGFDVRVEHRVSSQPQGVVISQAPAGGTGARPGRMVTIVLAKLQPSTSGGGGGPSCTPGYSPCLPLGPSDYDCYGGSGDGPAYTQPGVVYQVSGSDPYGLDADNDGQGCE